MNGAEYDEFGFFHENAQEFGLPFDKPPVVRRQAVEIGDGRRLSSLVWGDSAPEVVLLHGGAQNAHTWDTVALALGRPLLAVDLPGHGHSDGGRAGSLSPSDNAADVAVVIRALAPEARAVVGMSLGGLSSISLASQAPELVRRLVLVDVTPGVDSKKSSQIMAFIQGPETFESFEEILQRTIEFNPTRSVSSLRRGVLHNAIQQPDGTWVWRYRRFPAAPAGAFRDYHALWEDLSASKAPLMLVRGMLPQSVVDDADETELLARRPDARVEHVDNAGHSVQGDAPLELARLVSDFVFS
ncbi:MAG TPA: alpha/beta hydrolase [Acidimicrobiales bacterium]|nr:alpha/beta hydrolase [Acidimicrobiales bacterium]